MYYIIERKTGRIVTFNSSCGIVYGEKVYDGYDRQIDAAKACRMFNQFVGDKWAYCVRKL